MSCRIIFLCGTPSFTPGLLLKMFLDLPGVQVYFKPFTSSLDLFARYSITLRSDPRIPPGYFDSYTHPKNVLNQYPTAIENPDLSDLLPFLRDCISQAQDCAVFEISGSEKYLPKLFEAFPEAKAISASSLELGISGIRKLQFSSSELSEDYFSCIQSARTFSGLGHLIQESLFLNADWLKLSQSPPPPFKDDYCFPKMTRSELSTFLQQKETIIHLAKQETEIQALRSQLAQNQKPGKSKLKTKLKQLLNPWL